MRDFRSQTIKVLQGPLDIGFASDDNEVTLFARDAPPEAIGKRSKAAVAAALVDRIERELEALRGRSEPAAG